MHEDSFIIILQGILWMIPIVAIICFLLQKDDDETDDCSIFIDNENDDWF